MGDASFITLLSAVPLLIILASIAAALLAWRWGRREVRRAAPLFLIATGIVLVLSSFGVLFSMAGGGLIALLGWPSS